MTKISVHDYNARLLRPAVARNTQGVVCEVSCCKPMARHECPLSECLAGVYGGEALTCTCCYECRGDCARDI